MGWDLLWLFVSYMLLINGIQLQSESSWTMNLEEDSKRAYKQRIVAANLVCLALAVLYLGVIRGSW